MKKFCTFLPIRQAQVQENMEKKCRSGGGAKVVVSIGQDFGVDDPSGRGWCSLGCQCLEMEKLKEGDSRFNRTKLYTNVLVLI